MNTDEKIGQRIGLGFTGTKISDELKRHVKKYKAANIILFKDNLENAKQAKKLCVEIRELVEGETGHQPFIALDQEGGTVTRLPSDMVNVPGAMALAASGDTENIFLAAKITAAELKRIGINLNLAPVLDVNCNPDNPVIGSRSFGVRAEEVSHFAAAAIRAYSETGLMCCGKHFPGHGDTAIDSHLDLPLVDRSLCELEVRELLPFRSAINAGIPAIMTTHILFPQLEPQKFPATMSARILKGLLRENMGFKGLILSDGMEMKAVKDYYSVPKGCVLALAAGVDIVFICHESADMTKSLEAIKAAFDDGRFNIEEFDASVKRILEYREKYAGFGLNPPDINEDTIGSRHNENAALTRSTLALRYPEKPLPPLSRNPLFIGSLAYRSTIASAKPDSSLSFGNWFAKKMGGSSMKTPVNPGTADIENITANLGSCDSIVLGTYNGHLNRGQMDLALALYKTAEQRKIPFICLALRNPWDLSLLPEGVKGIACWEYSEKSFEAAAAALRGDFIPSGRMPDGRLPQA